MMKYLFLLTILVSNLWAGNNLHLIESKENGFAIYRTGKPDADDMKEFCKLGIEEMVVLSGTADEHEYKYQDSCPGLRVVFNEKMSARVPVKVSFLDFFDSWVEDARRTGKKIAFRCECGCHRTGRLAAYYQIKFQNVTTEDALILMKKHGKFMFLYPELKPQVRSMADYLAGRECSQDPEDCIIDDSGSAPIH